MQSVKAHPKTMCGCGAPYVQLDRLCTPQHHLIKGLRRDKIWATGHRPHPCVGALLYLPRGRFSFWHTQRTCISGSPERVQVSLARVLESQSAAQRSRSSQLTAKSAPALLTGNITQRCYSYLCQSTLFTSTSIYEALPMCQALW